MKSKYKKIHVWEFPPTRTHIRLRDEFRKGLFERLIKEFTYEEIAKIINRSARSYGIRRKYRHSHLSTWKKGFKQEKNKVDEINIPLWVLIEISKILSKGTKTDNLVMEKIEKNVISYRGTGKAKSIFSPKLPLYFTPELVSIVFHLCGDGHIGSNGVCSSYTQKNKESLQNVLTKLRNIFGEFDVQTKAFGDGHLIIPRVITDFFKFYFDLDDCRWDSARIPEKIKHLSDGFLLAGLVAFIADEGHISDVIELYSKNYELLNDIRGICLKLGYLSFPIKGKLKCGKLDQYRFLISLKSSKKFYDDIQNLCKNFPTCSLVHKSQDLEFIINRRNRKWLYRKHAVTKQMILGMLETNKSVKELSRLSLKPEC